LVEAGSFQSCCSCTMLVPKREGVLLSAALPGEIV
jgi:hypothetical protein